MLICTSCKFMLSSKKFPPLNKKSRMLLLSPCENEAKHIKKSDASFPLIDLWPVDQGPLVINSLGGRLTESSENFIRNTEFHQQKHEKASPTMLLQWHFHGKLKFSTDMYYYYGWCMNILQKKFSTKIHNFDFWGFYCQRGRYWILVCWLNGVGT